MHIIIVGGGGVGAALAKLLSDEKQDVIVIEKNPETARKLNEEVDAIVTASEGASAVALEKAGIKNASMLIAVTEVDEVNMIACMLAKKHDVPVTVARVRNPEYYEGSSILTNEQLGVDIFINPERVASFEIAKLIRTPDIGEETEYFAKGQVKLISFVVDENTKLVEQPLSSLPLPRDSIIAAIERADGKFIIPGGNDIIYPGDKVFITGKKNLLTEISWLLQRKETKAHKVVILGGGRIGLQLASILELSKKQHLNVKLIEKDPNCCEQIADSLKRTLVLQGDATDLSFLKQEEIQDADVLVAVTGDDRTNILASVLAKQFGVRKTICEVINQEYFSIFHSLGIEHVISPRLLTAAQILRLTRKGDVVSMSLLEDGKVEILELKIPPTARVAHKEIQHAGIPRGILLGAIIRGSEVIMPRGNNTLLPEDRVIIFASPKLNDEIDYLFAGNNTNNVDLREKKNSGLI